MRFDLKDVLSNVILSRNVRVIVEMACIPSIVNIAGKTAIVCLFTSTQYKVFDTKNVFIWQPHIILYGYQWNGSNIYFSNNFQEVIVNIFHFNYSAVPPCFEFILISSQVTQIINRKR